MKFLKNNAIKILTMGIFIVLGIHKLQSQEYSNFKQTLKKKV